MHPGRNHRDARCYTFNLKGTRAVVLAAANSRAAEALLLLQSPCDGHDMPSERSICRASLAKETF